MSSSQPPHPIQLRRQDLTPVARGWAEFIIHSMIPIGNKSEITVARAVSKLCFPSTIYRLCKEAGVPMREFKEAENRFANHDQDQEMHFEAAGAEEDHHQYHDQPHFEAYESNFQQYKEDQQQGFQFLNEELASMKIR
ncbi:hypothetical protein PIB30_086233 [Stylosanthes scabra]|uniref:Uncharacterized protein n=1 Tax=Stylosanthes scabra TaxID=79078 RepID=A0ABU6VWA4_9FABA|nr:hypothetical protein [Stylosanthes scabra]